MMEAAKNRDHQSYLRCHTSRMQHEILGSIAAGLWLRYNSSDRKDQILKTLRDHGITDLKALRKVQIGGDTPYSPGSAESIGKLITDAPEFMIASDKALGLPVGSAFPRIQQTTISDIMVLDNIASAATRIAGRDAQEMEFTKIDGVWLISK